MNRIYAHAFCRLLDASLHGAVFDQRMGLGRRSLHLVHLWGEGVDCTA